MGQFGNSPDFATFDIQQLDTITNNINNLSKRTGFIPDNPVLEIHGRCGACANNYLSA